MSNKFFLCALLLFCIFYGCGSKRATVLHSSKEDAGVAYDLSKPSKTWNLPDSLKEVSGNTWVDDEHLLLIEDLHPNLYLMLLQKDAAIEKQIPFVQQNDGKFDVEDVAVQGNTAYALWSHGVVYKIDNWNTKPAITELQTGLTKKNNTEGLCFDPVSKNLLIACKNKSGDEEEKKSTRAIYSFNLASGKLNEQPFLLIHKKDFEEKGGEALDFYPSAIAVQPKTHDLYILSTKKTKALAVYSYEGKLKSFQLIDKEEMSQPEGICFSPAGELYMSTQARHGQAAKIFLFHPPRR
jgi:sugar lactone lactonase YvrE